MQGTHHHGSKAAFFNEYIECPDYKSLPAIIKSFPHLKSLEVERNYENVKCRGLVIRCGNDDNIHKAIKYGIWTTTFRNKHKLQQYWREYQDKKIETLLFFSAVKSGHFEGVAKLISGYNDQTFPFWWENQNGKFKGHFEIEWIYVKDITNKHFDGLKNEMGEDFTKSKDCDDISEEVTKKVLQIYKNYKKNKTIFNTFAFFDSREKEELRSAPVYTPEQIWMMSKQFQQMQLMHHQQMMQYNMQQMPPMYYGSVQEVPFQVKQQHNGKAGTGQSNNPGFQMNPVSKNKKTNKDKDSK